MAAEPTLSELTSIKPEATINPGVILDSRDAIHQLNQSAQFNAQMKQQKYAQQLEMLKGIYQDLGKIQEIPIMDQDKPQLNKMMGDVLNKIAEDPRVALGGAGFNDIQRQLGQLRTASVQSKQDNLYNDTHNTILESDPSLATPENKGKVAQFNAAPLGHRQKYMLDTPVKFDPEGAFNKILQQKTVAVPYAETGFSGPHNEFITRTTGTTYRRQSALDLWNQGYDYMTDANGQPIKKWVTQQFEELKKDPDKFQKLGNPKDAKELWENMGSAMYGSKEDIVGEKTSTQTANPYAVQSARQNNALYMEGVREGNKEKLAGVRANLSLQGPAENANFLVRQYANYAGNTTGEKVPILLDGKNKAEDRVSIPMPILKSYFEDGKETIMEGKSGSPIRETIAQGRGPDEQTRTEDGNIRLTYYKRYQEADKKPKGAKAGDIILDFYGNKEVEKSGVIPKRNLMATIAKGAIPTKFLAASIDGADSFLKNQPNSKIDQINSGEGDGTAISPSHEVKTDGKKSYSLKGKNYSISQIEKAAKASGVSVEDYIKKVGLQ